MANDTGWRDETLVGEIRRVLKEADPFAIDRWRMCHGGSRCTRPVGAPMDGDCRYCFVFFSDDKRPPDEIAAAMKREH